MSKAARGGGGKTRADVALVERGLVESRAKAQALIMAGKVFCGERKLAKAGEAVAADQSLELRGQDHSWVSRGGLKLAHALDVFPIVAADAICLDLGASTGVLHRCSFECRRRAGLRRRRWPRPARLEAAQRPQGGGAGTHQCAAPDLG